MNGIKIAKPGVDVTKAKDNELLFNSSYPLLKIHKQGKFQIPIVQASGDVHKIVEIAHTVGKIPMFYVLGHLITDTFGGVVKVDEKLRLYGAGGTKISNLLGYSFNFVYPLPNKLVIEIICNNFGTTINLNLDVMYWIFEDPIVL